MLFKKLLGKDNLVSVPIISFIVLVIFIILIGVFAVSYENDIVKDNARLKLTSITDLKINQINNWRKERLIDAKDVLHNSSFIRDVNSWVLNRSDSESKKRILHYLNQYLESNYSEYILADKNFNILTASNSVLKLTEFEKGLFNEALERRGILFSDFTNENKTQPIHLDLVIPLIDENNEVGVLILKVNPEFFLFPYIQKWPIPSETSETLIIERSGDSVLFLNDLKNYKNAALNLTISLTQKKVLAVKAALGYEGFAEGFDYRNEEVMGVIKRIPGTKWIIIAKTDRTEIYSTERSKNFLIYTIILVVLSLTGAFLFLYLKNQSRVQYTKLLETEIDKQKVKNNLEASEFKFQALFNSMNEGVALHKVILNENGEPVDYVIIDINPAFEKNTGIKVEDARGVLASKLYGTGSPPYLDVFANVALTGKVYEFETYFAPLRRHFKISVTSPGYLMFATIFLDITSNKEYEQKLKTTVTSLEQSNRELEQFAYIASHDLQEPLRMVSSFTQLLEKKYKNQLSEEADSYIHYAVDGATRMQILINDLLEYSRVTRKGKPFTLVDSSILLGRAVSDLRKKIEENRAIVSNGDMPVIKADEVQITRLFQNLIDNAIKYKSDSNPLIYISAYENSDEWEFSIKDNGIGIDPEFNDRIFEIFERLHSASKYPGTGIGLAICKKIVERHGGRIWVESNPDKGVTFNFTISKREE